MLDPSRGIDSGVLRVVLADDHAIVREGLKVLVNAQSDMRVIGEASDGAAACDLVNRLRPDVVLLDLSMPKMNGMDATTCIRRESPAIRILALTVHEEREYLTQLLRAGAAGYVLKRAAPDELVRAIRTVAAGGTYIDPSLAGSVIASYLEAEKEAQGSEQILSSRERQVLVRIAQGFSNKEIAAALGLSVKTVETYKGRMSEKLGLRSRVDIVRYAVAQGWLAAHAEDVR
jgi:DNA-binding NarL/FixJ family response regulator